ncbi:hypothetical protein ABER31_12525, partial [Cutibacterium acnes]
MAKLKYPTYRKASYYASQLAAGTPVVIDCHGDSTMWGATTINVAVQDPNNQPAVLSTTLTNLYGMANTVNNRGISGTTMAQMLAGTDGSGSTFEAKMASSSANIVYCNHCINDSQLA